MPPREAIRRPTRLRGLRLNNFQGEVKLTWQSQVRDTLGDLTQAQVDADSEPSLTFRRLETMQQTAIGAAESFLGVTWGALRLHIRLHSQPHLGLDGLGYARYLGICQKDIFFISVRDIKNLIFLSNSA
jgi:hypothetical protein